jgi:hypothetical protein
VLLLAYKSIHASYFFFFCCHTVLDCCKIYVSLLLALSSPFFVSTIFQVADAQFGFGASIAENGLTKHGKSLENGLTKLGKGFEKGLERGLTKLGHAHQEGFENGLTTLGESVAWGFMGGCMILGVFFLLSTRWDDVGKLLRAMGVSATMVWDNVYDLLAHILRAMAVSATMVWDNVYNLLARILVLARKGLENGLTKLGEGFMSGFVILGVFFLLSTRWDDVCKLLAAMGVSATMVWDNVYNLLARILVRAKARFDAVCDDVGLCQNGA